MALPGESIADERAYYDERATTLSVMAWVNDPAGMTLDDVLAGRRSRQRPLPLVGRAVDDDAGS